MSFFFRIPRIYEQYKSTIEQANYEKDLKWWSLHHGTDMPMHWPTFEVSLNVVKGLLKVVKDMCYVSFVQQ